MGGGGGAGTLGFLNGPLSFRQGRVWGSSSFWVFMFCLFTLISHRVPDSVGFHVVVFLQSLISHWFLLIFGL